VVRLAETLHTPQLAAYLISSVQMSMGNPEIVPVYLIGLPSALRIGGIDQGPGGGAKIARLGGRVGPSQKLWEYPALLAKERLCCKAYLRGRPGLPFLCPERDSAADEMGGLK
jgi:hypothetical protein